MAALTMRNDQRHHQNEDRGGGHETGAWQTAGAGRDLTGFMVSRLLSVASVSGQAMGPPSADSRQNGTCMRRPTMGS